MFILKGCKSIFILIIVSFKILNNRIEIAVAIAAPFIPTIPKSARGLEEGINK